MAIHSPPDNEDMQKVEQLEIEQPEKKMPGLLGLYAGPELEDISFEEIEEYLIQVGREWEEEIDEFFGED